MHNRHRLIVGAAAGLFVFFVGLGPLLIPAGTTGTQTIFDLAYEDSDFLPVDGIAVHYRFTPHERGANGGPDAPAERSGGETSRARDSIEAPDASQAADARNPTDPPPLFVLLHGFGASTYTWREVQHRLAGLGDVVAFDRSGFGLTERPEPGSRLYATEGQHHILNTLLAHFDRERAILVGSSAGGTISLSYALAYPDRVASLILVSPAVYTGAGAPRSLQWILRLPQMNRIGPVLAGRIAGEAGDDFLRSSWYDPDRIPDEVYAGYRRPTLVAGWESGLWNLTASSGRHEPAAARLAEIATPALILTGDTDRVVPPEESIRLAAELPRATLAVVPESGHLAHEETPDAFMKAVRSFLRAP